MPRHALKSSDIKIEQKKDLPLTHGGPFDPKVPLPDRGGETIVAQKVLDKDYADELAFNEEPVTIRLEPSTDKNAATRFPVWVNGKGGEIFQDGRWFEIAYFPIGVPFTTKRKYLAVIIGAKIDTVSTEVLNPEAENPANNVRRFTSAIHSFSVIEDKNPRGAAWASELLRRNM